MTKQWEDHELQVRRWFCRTMDTGPTEGHNSIVSVSWLKPHAPEETVTKKYREHLRARAQLLKRQQTTIRKDALMHQVCSQLSLSLQSSLLAVIYNSSHGQNHNRRKTLWGWTQSWGKYKPRSFGPAKSCLLTPPAVLPLSPQVERAIPPSPCRILFPGLQLGGLFVSCSFQQDPAARGDILPIASTIWAQLGTQIDHYVLFNLFQFLCCENT